MESTWLRGLWLLRWEEGEKRGHRGGVVRRAGPIAPQHVGGLPVAASTLVGAVEGPTWPPTLQGTLGN